MASNIDPTKPVQGVPTTLSVRDNFLAARDEVEALQAADVTHSADIATNTGKISTNEAAIATNAGDITTNAAGIATNVSDIATNVGDIATNSGNIATNATAITGKLDTGGTAVDSDKVDGYHIVVTASPGSDANTLYFVPE